MRSIHVSRRLHVFIFLDRDAFASHIAYGVQVFGLPNPSMTEGLFLLFPFYFLIVKRLLMRSILVSRRLLVLNFRQGRKAPHIAYGGQVFVSMFFPF